MATTHAAGVWRSNDHFEPDGGRDPKEQRRLRGVLEQIDMIASSASRQTVGKLLGQVNAQAFEKIAEAAAHARVLWVATSLAIAQEGRPFTAEEVARVAEKRRAFEELTAAYEALRRLVERGYVAYQPRD
jgi:hypothetical protein